MVGEQRFPLWIDPKEEPIFREAGRRLNRKLTDYRTRYRGTGRTNEDLLAMTLIDLAVTLVRKEVSSDPEVIAGELDDLTADIQSFLDEPPVQP